MKVQDTIARLPEEVPAGSRADWATAWKSKSPLRTYSSGRSIPAEAPTVTSGCAC